MRGLEWWLFGYRLLRAEDLRAVSRLATLLLHRGISAEENGLVFKIKERDFSKISDDISRQKDVSVSEPLGLPRHIRTLITRPVTVICAILSALVIFLSGEVVWDVRIVGDIADSESIEAELSSLGLTEGALWSGLDYSKIETALLGASDSVAWVNLNRRGSVAYIELRSREHTETEESVGYSNVVATEDCVITEISVTEGYALVSVGEVVRRGDVLISGVLPPELGGGFCAASGSVKGIVDCEIEVEIPREITERVYGDGGLSSLSLKIFNFSINIFKIYGNSGESCDIIENNTQITLPDGRELPFSILRGYLVPYTETVRSVDDAELVRRASLLMRERILLRTEDGELCRAVTSGEFTDDGYAMRTCLSLTEEVGGRVPIAIE